MVGRLGAVLPRGHALKGRQDGGLQKGGQGIDIGTDSRSQSAMLPAATRVQIDFFCHRLLDCEARRPVCEARCTGQVNAGQPQLLQLIEWALLPFSFEGLFRGPLVVSCRSQSRDCSCAAQEYSRTFSVARYAQLEVVSGCSRSQGCCSQGAFSVAAKAGVPVVPITLIGTGALMPNGQEGRLYPGDGVRIIVHPKVQCAHLLTACVRTRQESAHGHSAITLAFPRNHRLRWDVAA